MNNKHSLCCMILLSISFTITSASTLPSGGRDEMLHSTGRSILQDKPQCPVNIETLNYNNLTSQCKQPWQVQPCCDGFVELVCPYVDQISDLRNDCADRLFKYFDFLGYPDGLFANICTETKQILPCPATTLVKDDASADRRLSNPSHKLIIFTPTFLLLLLGVLGS